MKTKNLFKAFALIAILFVNIAAVSARNLDGNLIYNTEEKDGVMMGQTIYKMEGNTLLHYMKHNYQYDDQKRMTQSETQKWNNNKQRWENNLLVTYSYTGKTVTTNYYQWNNKKNEYILAPELTVTLDNRDI